MSTSELIDPEYLKIESKAIDELGREFTVPERRIKHVDDRLLPEEIIRVISKLDLDKQDILRLEVSNDPVRWAEAYLVNPDNHAEPLSLRFYQKDILSTPSRFKVLRLGRQMGKCVHENTYISLPDGVSESANDLFNKHGETNSFNIVSYNEEAKTLETSEAYIHDNGNEDTILIETRSGYKSAFTYDHKAKVYNKDGNIEDKLAKDVLIGDYVPISGTEEKFLMSRSEETEFEGLNEDDMTIIGIMTFVGIKEYDTSIEYRRDDNIVEEALDSYAERTPECKIYSTTERLNNKYRIVFLNGNNKLLSFLERYDMLPFDKSSNELPDFVYKLPPKLMIGFLRGVFSCRSVFRGKDYEKHIITSETVYDDYSNKIFVMLRKLGFKAWRRHKYGSKNSSKPDSIYVHISDPGHIAWFMNTIGRFTSDDKWNEFKSKIMNILDLDENKFTNYKPDELDEITKDEVIKITHLGSARTYNISVKDNHNYLAGGILTSNSVVMAVDIIWRAINTNNFQIVVVAPYLSQITTIFSRIKALMSGHSPISKDIVRNKINPPLFEFSNGSTIKGFVAGDSVTGQSANAIYYDESDYIGDKEKERINPVVFNFPNHIIVQASTPSGRRGNFYRTSTDQNSYVEFHYPTHCSPKWTAIMDNDYLENHTRAAYQHEICFEKNTLIATNNGDKKIIDISISDIIYNENLKFCKVLTAAKCTGIKDIWKHSTSAGDILCTKDHSFPNYEFIKKPIHTLNMLPIYQINRIYGNDPREEIYARLIGFNLGDGSSCSTRYQSSFYSNNESDIDNVITDIKSLYPEYKGSNIKDIVFASQRVNTIVHVDGVRHTANVSVKITKDFIKRDLIRGKKTYQEFDVPKFILNGTLKVKSNFISALFGAEGSTPRGIKNGYIPSTISLTMAKQINVNGHDFFSSLVFILNELGVRSIYTHNVDKVGYQIYSLYVYSDIDNMIAFHEHVGYRYAIEKEKLSHHWLHYLKHYKYTLTKKQEKFQMARDIHKFGDSSDMTAEIVKITSSQVRKAIYRKRIPRRLYKNEFQKFDNWIKNRVSNDVLFIDILDRAFNKTENVYNITVSTLDHSYLLANGIRTFNCANFGSPESGVFRGIDINACIENSKIIEDINQKGKAYKRSYTYKEFTELNYRKDKKANEQPIYIIGVDWNGADNGTQIVVLSYMNNKLYVSNIVSISGHEFTQTKAVEEVARLNDIYNPLTIYVDVGFGGMQIEALHIYGKKYPDTLLHKRVVGIDFTKKIEIPDPMTNEISKKRLKQFMIDRFQRMTENHRLVIPSQENANGGLAEEMRNFQIERYSIDGSPIYSKKTADHKIMATALGILAYYQLIEKIDRFDYVTGTGKVSSNISKRIRANTFGSGFTNRRKFETLDDVSSKNRPTKTLESLTGFKVEYSGIVKLSSHKINDKDEYKMNPSKYSKMSGKSMQPRSRGSRSRF